MSTNATRLHETSKSASRVLAVLDGRRHEGRRGDDDVRAALTALRRDCERELRGIHGVHMPRYATSADNPHRVPQWLDAQRVQHALRYPNKGIVEARALFAVGGDTIVNAVVAIEREWSLSSVITPDSLHGS